MAKLWLMAYHASQYSKADFQLMFTPRIHDRLFFTSLELIEQCWLLECHEQTGKWAWLFGTYFQWHALAYLLSELCRNPVRSDSGRAWKAIDQYYDKRVVHRPQNQNGMLWQPLVHLMSKARAAREALTATTTAVTGTQSQVVPNRSTMDTLWLSSSAPHVLESSGLASEALSKQQGVPSTRPIGSSSSQQQCYKPPDTFTPTAPAARYHSEMCSSYFDADSAATASLGQGFYPVAGGHELTSLPNWSQAPLDLDLEDANITTPTFENILLSHTVDGWL